VQIPHSCLDLGGAQLGKGERICLLAAEDLVAGPDLQMCTVSFSFNVDRKPALTSFWHARLQKKRLRPLVAQPRSASSASSDTPYTLLLGIRLFQPSRKPSSPSCDLRSVSD
jgi:hypothetical protein